MASTKMFRNSISGYNKEDVNKYIRDTDAAHSAALSEAEAKIADLEARNKSLSDGISAANAEIISLRETKDEFEKKESEFSATVAKKIEEINDIKKESNFHKAECEAQKNVISTLKAERDALLSEIDKLKAAPLPMNTENATLEVEDVTADDKDSDQYKLDMYNKISSQLGDIIINANRTAEEIVSRAKNEAESLKNITENEVREKRALCDAEISKIKNDSEEEAAYIRKRLSDIAEELLTRVSSDLHNSIDSSVREINTYVSDVQFEIKALATKIEARSDEMYDRLGYYRASVTDSIGGRLSEMDKKYGIKNNSSEE